MNPASMQQQQQRAMLIENAKRELRALVQQRNIAEQGIEALSGVAAELSGHSNDAAILRDAARELETGVVHHLEGDTEGIPDRATDLRRIADRIQMVETVGDKPNRVMLSALVALVSIRLVELQTGHANAAERIPKLEAFLKQAESGIAIPNLVI